MSCARLASALLLVVSSVQAAPSTPVDVLAEMKISSGSGGFTGVLGAFDGFGTTTAAIGDLDDNGVGDLAVGAPGSTTPLGGAVWILLMAHDGTVLSHSRIDGTTPGVTLDTNDQFGCSVALLGDLDDDGHPELAVGAANEGPGLFLGTGAVHIFSLGTAGEVLSSQTLLEGSSGVPGPATGTGFGTAVAGVGDLDANGVPDMAVSDTFGSTGSEVVMLMRLKPDKTLVTTKLITPADAGFGGLAQPDSGFGRGLSGLGDIDNNGLPDIGIGEPGAGATNKGGVWLVFLKVGLQILSAKHVAEGEDSFAGPLADQAGFGNAITAGDVDQDGRTDLIVGSSLDADLMGSAWVISVSPNGTVTSAQHLGQGLLGFEGPLAEDDQFGSSLALLPDATGADQIIAGARGDSGAFIVGPGALWVLDIEPPTLWTNLGSSLAGVDGKPVLTGQGPLTDSSLNSLNLAHANPNSVSTVVVGLSTIFAPLKGGVLVPAPDVLALGLPTLNGTLNIPFTFPSGVPSGVHLYFQHWIVDPAGPKGLAVSNGLQAVTP